MRALLVAMLSAASMLLPSTADARDDDDEGNLSLSSRTMIGGGATFGEGTRPAWADSVTSYAIREYSLYVRSSLPLSRPNTLGSKFAIEWMGAALYASEDPFVAVRGATALSARGAFGIGGRALTLGDRDARFALVLHANVEAGIGGQYWWSDSARLSPMAGPRLLLGLWDDVFAELDYAFVPDYLTGSPHGMRVNRWEHRATLSLGFGELGIGARVLVSSERTHTPLPELTRSHSSSVFGFVEWRIPQ